MAQEVERILGKDEVASSTLASSSKTPPVHCKPGSFVFLFEVFILLVNYIVIMYNGSNKDEGRFCMNPKHPFTFLMAILNTILLWVSIITGYVPKDALRSYLHFGSMKVSDVAVQSDAVYFSADGEKCVLQFTAPHGWRLRTAKADGTFDDFGAGQTLARDLGEEIPDAVCVITANAANDQFTAPDGSTARFDSREGLVVSLPSGKRAFNVDAIYKDQNGTLHVSGDLDWSERLYGTGEKYDYLNQRGQRVEIFSMDVWSVQDGRSYLQIPVVASSRGCGLFMNRFEHMFMDLGCYAKNRYDFELPHGPCDLYIFTTEKISDVLYGYSVISGFAAEPAEWMYGTQICRYAPEFSTPQGVYDMAKNMEENGFPWDAVIIEGFEAFNRSNWTQLREISDFVHAKGKKLMVYTRCGNGGGYYEPYMLHNAAGSTQINRVNASERAGYGYLMKSTFDYVDLTNPDAVNWMYTGVWKTLINDYGVDGAKIDFCENVPDYVTSPESTLVFFDGRETPGAHHWYPSLYNAMLFNFLNENSENGAMVFARGGGIGAQRYPLSWTGDQKREFTFLKTQLRACLSSGLSGVPFMSYDMAGYSPSTNKTLNPPAEVFTRGLEYTCFSANIETHGTVQRAYDFDDATKNLYRIYANMHDVMRPYLVEEGRICTETALPLMRALVLYDQNDEKCMDTWDEYMLGDGFLVAPVLDRSASSRSVYLPQGSWTDLYTGEVYEGGRTLHFYQAPIAKIPVFVNNNSASQTLSSVLRAMQPYVDEINALCR